MVFRRLSRVILLSSDLDAFINKVQIKLGRVTKSFELIQDLSQIIKGHKINLNAPATGEDKFSIVLSELVTAFGKNKDNHKEFADNIYKAKLTARNNKLNQIELFCDLLIGYSYFKLNKHNKANTIYHNVLEKSIQNGLKFITHIAWYLISMINI